nr:hypothetical protein [Tanacetum cinerariifolium]
MISKEDNRSKIDLEEIQEYADEEPIVNTNTQQEAVTPVEPNDISLTIRKTSSRVRKPRHLYYGFHIEKDKISDSTLSELDKPANYKEAMASLEAAKWKEAIKSEIQSMYENQIWNLVDTTPDLKMVGCKWIFKKKTYIDGKVYTYKDRLVVKGYTQTHGIDYEKTFSPMDVKTAFFNEKLTEDVFMAQPEGFENAKSKDESCIYVKVSKSVMVLYVDDILLIGNDIPTLQSVKDGLGKCFAMKELGDATYILGIKIYRDRKRNLPLNHGIKISKDLCSKTNEELDKISRVSHALAIGSIMYAMTCTRLGVSFALSMSLSCNGTLGVRILLSLVRGCKLLEVLSFGYASKFDQGGMRVRNLIFSKGIENPSVLSGTHAYSIDIEMCLMTWLHQSSEKHMKLITYCHQIFQSLLDLIHQPRSLRFEKFVLRMELQWKTLCSSTMIEDVKVALDKRQIGEEAAILEMEMVYKLDSQALTHKPTTAEEKQDRRNDMKATGTLWMELPNKDQPKFHSYQDAKLLMEAIEKRLQKLISQLELQGEVIQQEDMNLKLLRSLPSEWKTHVIIWRNKAELETANTTTSVISTAHTQGTTINSTSVDNLSDAMICAFLSYQAEEETPINYAFMALTSSGSSSSSDFESKAGLGYKELIPESFGNSSELLEKQNNRSTKGYHEVPPPLTGNYMPPKRDLRLIDEHFESESVDVSTVSSSDDKTVDITHKVLTRSTKNNTATVSVNTIVRPVNAAGSQSIVNHSRSISKVIPRKQLQQTRPFNKLSSNKRSVFNKKVNTVRVNDSTARERAVVNGNIGREGNPQQKEYKEKRVINSSCSRHMTGNKCYLTDFEAFDGGFVSFRDEKGKISGKGIENQLDCKVRFIRSDNGTKFKNSAMTQFYDEKGNGPDWIFDIDSLTISMNYVPVVTGNQTNGTRGTNKKLVAGQDEKKKELEQEYILIPIYTTGPLISQDAKDSAKDARKKAPEVDAGEALDNYGQDNQVSRSKDGSLFQQDRQTKHNNSTNDINTVSLPISTAGPSFVNAASQIQLNAIGPSANDTGIFGNAYDDDVLEAEVDMKNVDSSYAILEATKFLKYHPQEQVIRSLETPV